MKLKTFDHMNCSLAQTLEVIGERWTLLILRDAFLGSRRFQQFQANLGIARNILTVRLNRLVEEGILRKHPIDEGERHEYRLTAKGLDLQPILLSMTHWGDAHKPHPKGARLVFVERATGEPIARMRVISSEGRPLEPREVGVVVGPALQAAAPAKKRVPRRSR
jgi:DNA-binding HxlR family transcriptional regulator